MIESIRNCEIRIVSQREIKERRTCLDLPTYYFTLYSYVLAVESDTLYDKGIRFVRDITKDNCGKKSVEYILIQ